MRATTVLTALALFGSEHALNASAATAAATGPSAAADPIVVPSKRYTCVDDFCRPTTAAVDLNTTLRPPAGQALEVCSLVCGNGGALWPLPSRNFTLASTVQPFDTFAPTWNVVAASSVGAEGAHLRKVLDSHWQSFSRKLRRSPGEQSEGGNGRINRSSGRVASEITVPVNITVVNASCSALLLDTDESYSLEVVSPGTHVDIVAATCYGARHALETLSQLVALDSDAQQQYIVASASIDDAPAFPYRGVMIDVSRNFLPLGTIKSIVEAMGANKLNTLHLHLSDTSSFPVHTPRRPNVTAYGAYSQAMSFSQEDLQQLGAFANVHGVRLVPEIDVPAHVGAGYQWTVDAGLGDVVVCHGDQQAWGSQALEPPSGQLDPTNENTYAILSDVYADVVDAFGASSLFHLGGDEVIVGCDDHTCWPESGCQTCFAACWNSSKFAPSIGNFLTANGFNTEDPQSFYGLWKNFTIRARKLVHEAFANRTQTRRPSDKGSDDPRGSSKASFLSTVPLQKTLQWAGSPTGGSTVTYNLMGQEDLETFLPTESFVLEVWDNLNGSIATDLMDKGYDIVLAHTDYVYLDCGQEGWVSPGGYWCEPYHEWYRIYEYLPDARRTWGRALNPQSPTNHILGSEVLLWAEEIDTSNVQQKLWPRAAALAERLWADPDPTGVDGWFAADHRMQLHRERLVKRGYGAAALQPRWCLQHPGTCTLPASPGTDKTATAYRTGGVPHEQKVQAGDALYELDAAGAGR
eukprot:INCI5592.1.p1 GENE.INCI5592.1~~INCI5592.1.p1  ORF type:complete len:790 (+),score=130.02 INCI5592.1:122-2371(+)